MIAKVKELEKKNEEIETQLAAARDNDPNVIKDLGFSPLASCFVCCICDNLLPHMCTNIKNDPHLNFITVIRVAVTEKKVEIARMGVNRWTDNVWALKSVLVSKYSMNSRDVDRQLQLPDDFDYVE